MTFGENILRLRKESGLTQAEQAEKLGVTFQAVSKWENDQAYPDVTLLPVLADLFGVSIDALLNHETTKAPAQSSVLPWDDDGTYRIVVYKGHALLEEKAVAELNGQTELPIASIKGAGWNVVSALSVSCGNVAHDVTAGGNVECCHVGNEKTNGVDAGGRVTAGGNVECGGVSGDVHADGNVECGDVGGNVRADGKVACCDVRGDVDTHGDVACGDVGGNVIADSNVGCGGVSGNVRADGKVACCDVRGDVDTHGDVACGDVGGNVIADSSVECGGVSGDVRSDGKAEHNDMCGDVNAR